MPPSRGGSSGSAGHGRSHAAAAPATERPQPPPNGRCGSPAPAATADCGSTAGGGDLAALLTAADPAQGQTIAKKCDACHNFEKGGPNKVGPNLWDIVGAKHAHKDDYSYSDAIKGMADKEWSYAELDEFLTTPKAYAPGTKMTFPGLKKPEDRAAVIAYLRSLSDSPKPLP